MLCPNCQKAFEEPPNFCPACGADLRGLTPTADTLSGPWSGKVIDGRYRLLEKLGEGGMGAVFKVEHVRMGKLCALKLLRNDLALDRKLKERFRQEARVVSRLSHPNTIQVFDFGELEDGSLYLAMEYLPGRDLAWTLRAQGPLSEEKALSIGIQVLASLQEAHDQGVVHRDIKPANVMLVKRRERDDLVKVLDFGIAKLQEAEGRKHITGVADVLGTPQYMSPEQAQGEPLDARSDVYSVGAMLFELVTGKAVFAGPTPMSVVTKHITEPPPRMAEVAPGCTVSPTFEKVIRKALSKSREDRWASAAHMQRALEAARQELGGHSGDFTPLPEELATRMASRQDFDRFERSLRVRRALAPLMVLALVGGTAVAGFVYLRQRPAPQVVEAEVEPNDSAATATAIAAGVRVVGSIGAGANGRSDRDVFTVEVPPGPVAVTLSGVPDLNLALEVTEFGPVADGGREQPLSRSVVDDAPVGGGERLDGFFARSGRLYLRVEERQHYTEPGTRGPREKSTVPYALQVTLLEGGRPGLQLEMEPNDTPQQATPAALGRVVRGYAGVPVGYPPPRGVTLTGADFFVAPELDERSGANAAAVVIPPPGHRLAVVDLVAWETWAQQVSSASARGKPLPEPAPTWVVGPTLVSLQHRSGGHGVRVQAVDRATPAGASYLVVFVSDGPGGVAGVVELSRQLASEGRSRERTAAIEQVIKGLPLSPNLKDLLTLLQGSP